MIAGDHLMTDAPVATYLQLPILFLAECLGLSVDIVHPLVAVERFISHVAACHLISSPGKKCIQIRWCPSPKHGRHLESSQRTTDVAGDFKTRAHIVTASLLDFIRHE